MDDNNTALLITDVQVAFFEAPEPVYRGQEVLGKIRQLIDAARSQNVPVIYLQHNTGGELDGTRLWQIHPDIAPAPGELVIQKYTPDSFYQTNLQQELEARKVTRLILMGFATEYCIDTTCRRAWSLGYKVALVKDAHSTFNSPILAAPQIVEHHSNVLKAFAEVCEAGEIVLMS